MKDLMYLIGFFLRIPLFAIRLILWTCLALPMAFFCKLLEIILIPFAFLIAAFENKPEEFENSIKSTFKFDFPLIRSMLKEIIDCLKNGESFP